MSVSVKNVREESDYSDAVEFEPSGIPNAPVLMNLLNLILNYPFHGKKHLIIVNGL